MARLKNFQGWISTPYKVDARHFDGRSVSQVSAAVRAVSQKAAAEALRVSLSFFRNYVCETGNQECITALDQYPPGTVLLRSMNTGGSVNGSTGWVVRP